MTPEARAGVEIGRLLEAAGWRVCDYEAARVHAATGVAIREFPLVEGYGHADYLLKTCGKSAKLADIEAVILESFKAAMRNSSTICSQSPADNLLRTLRYRSGAA